jgi:hypothetical protein
MLQHEALLLQRQGYATHYAIPYELYTAIYYCSATML